MAGKNVIRSDLAEAVQRTSSLSRAESDRLVGQILGEICDTLARSESVQLSGFGAFNVRDKVERVGRNPKTAVEVPIEPRKSITFSASPLGTGERRQRETPPGVEPNGVPCCQTKKKRLPKADA